MCVKGGADAAPTPTQSRPQSQAPLLVALHDLALIRALGWPRRAGAGVARLRARLGGAPLGPEGEWGTDSVGQRTPCNAWPARWWAQGVKQQSTQSGAAVLPPAHLC